MTTDSGDISREADVEIRNPQKVTGRESGRFSDQSQCQDTRTHGVSVRFCRYLDDRT